MYDTNPVKMSSVEDDHADYDEEHDIEENYNDEDARYSQDDQFSDEDQYNSDSPIQKHDERRQSRGGRNRNRAQGQNQFRQGPRQGWPRGPMRGMPMGNNRNNAPFDNYGPPMGMPRGFHPRYGPPRYPNMTEEPQEEEEGINNENFAGQCGDGPPNNFMRMRGPMGFKGIPPDQNMPPFNGPPFNGPNTNFNGAPGPYNQPPFIPPVGQFGPPYGGPFDPSFMPPGGPGFMPGRPFPGPPNVPPFGAPPTTSSAPPSESEPATSTPTSTCNMSPTLSTAPTTSINQPGTPTQSGFNYSTAPSGVTDGSQFGMPPPGFGGPPRPPMGMPPMGGPGMPPGFPMPMMGPPPFGVMPPFRPPMPFIPPVVPMTGGYPPSAPQKTADDVWVENTTADGKSYYYNMRTRETRWDRPDGVTVVRQGEVEGTAKAPTTTTTTPQQKPAEVALWSEYHNPEGKPYYHNSKTGETTWEKPKVLEDWEKQQSGATTTAEKTLSVPAVPTTNNTVPISDAKPTLLNNQMNNLDSVQKKTELTQNGNQLDTQSETKEEKIAKDSSRPVSSTAVHGTPWCVVWTGDGRAFFFNPSQRLSVWEKPEELKNRADVDRLLERQPNSLTNSNDNSFQKELSVEKNETETEIGASLSKKPRLEEPETNGVVLESEKKEPIMEIDNDKNTTPSDKIPVGREAAKEAEEKAARERAVLPMEVRVSRFREMLLEMQVSAFSTWEKELHKIVFDPRYLLLASKERKQTFEAFVRERAEDERREKKHKFKERKENFNELLEEASLNFKSSFSDFAAKYSKDERFKAVEKSRDRETMFQDFVSELRKQEKEDKHREKEKVKTDFIGLLKEQKNLTRQTHWSDLKRKIDHDPRYKAVDSSSRREDLFREYVRKLDEPSSDHEDSVSRKEREKQERQEASLREREKEVKEALSNSLRERDKEREQQIRIEQETNFRSMLQTMIRDPNMSWKEAKKILRKDSRWDDVSEVFERSEREEMFNDHMCGLSKKTREAFHKLLNECDEVTFALSWKEAKKIIQSDPRYEKLPSDKKRESDFNMWVEQKKTHAMDNLRELLKETRIINHKTKMALDDNSTNISDILAVLEKDKRYRALNSFQDERNALIEDYIDSIAGRQSPSSRR